MFRTSGYGITDEQFYNDDVKLRLVEPEEGVEHGVDIIANGQRENTEKDGDITHGRLADPQRSIPKVRKRALAAKPVRHALKEGQRHLSIWYDSKAEHLTMKQEGVHMPQLPPIVERDVIYQHKIEKTDDGDTRQV